MIFPVPLPAMKGRRCLVLGGGGFLGQNLCRALAEAGAEPFSFGRRAPAGVHATTGEIADPAALARALAGQEIVFHLVGGSLPEKSNADPVADIEAGVIGTVRILDQCRAAGVRQIVFASSGGTVYGIAPSTPIPETAPTNPISAYGISRLAIEKYLHLYSHLHGLDYRVLRIANPYGRHQAGDRPQGVIAALLCRALRGEALDIWGDGSVVRDFVHVEDVAAAFLHVSLCKGGTRVFNVGSGSGLSVNRIADDIERVIGRGPLARSWRPSRPADVPVNILDIALITRQTGWRPSVGWLDGLRDTAEWLSNE